MEGPAVDAGKAERSTGMKGGKGDGMRVGAPTGMVRGGLVAAVTGRGALVGG